jgi:hypothetical protein
MSRSTKAGAPSGSQSTRSSSPAFTHAEEKLLASSEVKSAISVDS